MVEYDDTTGLPRYYDYVVCNERGDELESFFDEESANEYLQKHQPDGENWYVGCDEMTAWYCRKRVGTFNLEEHGFDLASYTEDTDGMEAILKIYNKSYAVVIREITTMHDDGIFIPWEDAKSFVEDDGFAMDMLNVSGWVAQYEIQCAFDDFMHEGTDTHHSCYWEDMEDCDWFEEQLMMQKTELEHGNS